MFSCLFTPPTAHCPEAEPEGPNPVQARDATLSRQCETHMMSYLGFQVTFCAHCTWAAADQPGMLQRKYRRQCRICCWDTKTNCLIACLQLQGPAHTKTQELFFLAFQRVFLSDQHQLFVVVQPGSLSAPAPTAFSSPPPSFILQQQRTMQGLCSRMTTSQGGVLSTRTPSLPCTCIRQQQRQLQQTQQQQQHTHARSGFQLQAFSGGMSDLGG